MKDNIIIEKSLEFAVKITPLYHKMVQSREYVISKQLLRASTSIGANVQEASAAQTKKDFLTKMCIASKEARETRYWLIYLERSRFVDFDLAELLSDIEEVNKILTSIVITTKENIKKDQSR